MPAPKPSRKTLAVLAIALLTGCSARITAGVAADTSGGVGPRFGLALGYGSPRARGHRVRRPAIEAGVTRPGDEQTLVDTTIGYERLMLPPDMSGLAYRFSGGVGWMNRSDRDDNQRDDLVILRGAVAVTRARASRRPPDPKRQRKWHEFSLVKSVQWHQYGLELGAIVGAEPGLDNPFGLAHLSALYEISSWPDRR